VEEMKKLVGVVFIGIMAILIGLFVIYLTWGITATMESGWNAISVTLVAIASCFVVCGVFLLKLKNWARIFFIIAMSVWFGFGILCAVRNYLFGMIVYTVGLEGLVIYKWILKGSGQIIADYSGSNAKKFTHKKIAD